jgi:hypothetical protein
MLSAKSSVEALATTTIMALGLTFTLSDERKVEKAEREGLTHF